MYRKPTLRLKKIDGFDTEFSQIRDSVKRCFFFEGLL